MLLLLVLLKWFMTDSVGGGPHAKHEIYKTNRGNLL